MIKRSILAVVAVFIALSAIDMVIHGILLQSTYRDTAELWRPMEEMKMSLMYFISTLIVVCFVAIYGILVAEKTFAAGLKFGVLFGLAFGISMGFGSYSYMPIPLSLAWTWFAGTLVEFTVAGAIVGAIVKPATSA